MSDLQKLKAVLTEIGIPFESRFYKESSEEDVTFCCSYGHTFAIEFTDGNYTGTWDDIG